MVRNSNNTDKTRIPAVLGVSRLPAGWRLVRLHELVAESRKIRYGIVQPGSYDPLGRYMVRGQDYSFGWVLPESLFRVSDGVEGRYRSARLRPGDLIITIVGAGTGTVAKVPDWLDGANITQTTARIAIEPTEAVSEYVFQYLTSGFGKRLTYNYIKGGAQPGLNVCDLEKFAIVLPSMPEQVRISAILSTWDRAIEQTQMLIDSKIQLKRGLMQQLLNSRNENGAAWPVVPLRSITKPVKRRNEIGVGRVLTASGEHGLIDQREFFKKSVAGEDLSNYYLLEKGEFAYNRSAMNGYPYGATKRLTAYDSGALSTLYICFRFADSQIHSEFYEYLFESGYMDKQLRTIAQVGARAHGLLNVTEGDFYSIKVPKPSKEEQRHIAQLILTVDTWIELESKRLDLLQLQKRGLMQVLLTGKVRVKV